MFISLIFYFYFISFLKFFIYFFQFFKFFFSIFSSFLKRKNYSIFYYKFPEILIFSPKISSNVSDKIKKEKRGHSRIREAPFPRPMISPLENSIRPLTTNVSEKLKQEKKGQSRSSGTREASFPRPMISPLENSIRPLYSKCIKPISREEWLEVDKLIEAAVKR